MTSATEYIDVVSTDIILLKHQDDTNKPRLALISGMIFMSGMYIIGVDGAGNTIRWA